jgi:hypothetical protein
VLRKKYLYVRGVKVAGDKSTASGKLSKLSANSSHNIIMSIKWGRVRETGCFERQRNVGYTGSEGRTAGGRSRSKWKDTRKVYLKEI